VKRNGRSATPITKISTKATFFTKWTSRCQIARIDPLWLAAGCWDTLPDAYSGFKTQNVRGARLGGGTQPCGNVEGEGHFHGPGAWPFGITAYAGREDNDLILWLPSINAIVTGDSLSDFGEGLDIQLGGRKHVTRDDVVRRLRPLLDLPVELVLPAHGEPTDRAALQRVLS
jgi:hypothetical protein